jgi:dihydroflavonol-4-reductase
MERGHAGHRYVLGGESMPLSQVLELMGDISGRRVRRIQVNAKVAEMVTATLEFIADHVTRRPPSGTAEGVRIALRAGALSIEKAQRELGYAPGPVEPVLRETIAHLLDAGHNQPEWGSTPSTRPRPFHVERRVGG